MKDFKLNNYPKINSGFQIPEKYFDTFSDKVMKQLPNQNGKVISIFDRNKRWFFGTAAILVLSLSILITNQIQNKNQERVLEIENYLAYQSSISTDDIIEFLDKDDIEKIKISNSIDNQTIEEELFKNIDLENYITN